MSDTIFAERGTRSEIETGDRLQPKFDDNGLIVCVVTNADDGTILMVGYMNAEALRRTIDTGEAWYWSRSRQSFWKKGETSGQVQKVVEIRTDCDQDAIELRVRVKGNGATCHVGYRSCFFRKVEKRPDGGVGLVLAGGERVYDPKDVYGKS
ncbi:phosphoribosyl-AMP cyclohydrolase [Stappia sp. GBMRC 2046]|uniref:Phosphoribosyl-AMP cyclohydrolase n=1 Tax=Stappia sediminis TaxID=2692190 RepID=A0A7X3S6C2_9HYPH|nr:phosphoribosyl-AMP cyclohydrolase [Stappia sediminis]MXN63838.1 phosphoribosyl-AMP cyclohydrolase [Stappia sediminis]